MTKQKMVISDVLLEVAIFMNLVSFLDVNVFRWYERWSLYGNIALMILIFVLQNKVRKVDSAKWRFFFVFMSYGLVTLFFGDGGFGSVLIVGYSVLVLLVISNATFSDATIKRLLMMFLGVNLFWVINSKGYYYRFLFNQKNYINSNTIGMVLAYSAIYISIFVRKLQIKGAMWIAVAVFVFSGMAILNCQARGSFITMCVFVVLDLLIPKRFWGRKRRLPALALGAVFLGVVFPLVYVAAYRSGLDYNVLATSKSLFTGRQVIWSSFFSAMNDKPASWFIGLGSRVGAWTEASLSLHNNYLAVIANFGIVGFALYYWFLISQINNAVKQPLIEDIQISLILGFTCVLINGFVEITSLWHIMFFMNFMFLGLAEMAQ